MSLQRQAVEFDYPAKSGVRRTLTIDDPEVVRSVRALLRRPDRTERLLVCRNSTAWDDIHADDLNVRFKELVGDEYSVKDLRTWHGTVLAAAAFVDADPPVNKTVIKRVESAVMKEVSEELGNTPAVARGSYVDPRVVEGYEKGLTIAAGVRRADRTKNTERTQAILEDSTARTDPQGGSRLVRPGSSPADSGPGRRRSAACPRRSGPMNTGPARDLVPRRQSSAAGTNHAAAH